MLPSNFRPRPAQIRGPQIVLPAKDQSPGEVDQTAIGQAMQKRKDRQDRERLQLALANAKAMDDARNQGSLTARYLWAKHG